MDQVIEPSEIIVDQPGVEEDTSRINPYVRWLSRFFDYSLLALLLSLIYYLIGIEKKEFLIPLRFLLWVPLEAFFLSQWGYTPGRLLLKTRVSKLGGGKLDFRLALRRSFAVWFRGIGMGLPVINVITMAIGFSSLKRQGISSWDRDEKTVVFHHFVKPIRIGLALGLILLTFALDFF